MKKERVRVLYIDDEINNLNSFKALFRKEYDVFLAESAEEGMKFLSQEKVHVIIADQRMPGMTGVEFFESILHTYPHPIRILLTGYTDIQAVIEAINRGQIYRFIDKPWDQQAISVAIQNAYEIYHTKFLLREQNIELQKAYEELDKFVYSASHDLRAPLASILGIVKVAKTEGPESKDDYLSMIESTVHKMDVFVQNIIKYYRTTRTGFSPNFIHIETLVNDIWDDYKTLKETEKIHFGYSNNKAGSIRTDEGRIRIILTNILLNTIRFQDEQKEIRKVHVNINYTREGVTLEVEDNGIGIDPKHQDEIFTMFFRGAHRNAGSGVGLYVVKEAMKKLDGKISVKSKPGVGTTFILEIPNRE